MNRSHRIVVMLGGPGAEREVSLRSGAAVAAALRSRGHAVEELDPVNRSFVLPTHTDVVFLALHGAYGEDGTVQRQLEELGMPYTGCGPETSRVAFDKLLTKERCVKAGAPTPRFAIFDSSQTPWPDDWQPPVVVKPVRQGSSVGLRFVERVEEWPAALAECLRHDDRVLLEERVVGRECTVGILDGQALPLVEVRPHSGVYDYSSKYTTGASQYLCPAPFSEVVAAQIQSAAMNAFAAVGGGDYARVDVMVDAQDRPFVLEVNTLPGMTDTSLFPKSAAAAGVGYADLCERLIELALRRGAQKWRPVETC